MTSKTSKKARKVKAKPKAKPRAAAQAHKAARPRIVKRRMRGGDATPREPEPAPARAPASAAALAAAHSEAPAVTQPKGPAPPAGGPPGGLSRLQRMMAASADNDAGLTVKANSPDMPGALAAVDDEPVVARKPSAPPPPPPPPPPAAKGRQIVVEDDDAGDDGFVVAGGSKAAGTKVEKAEDGIAVVSKGPARFSTEDMEALRKAIVIKGGGLVVAGINLDDLKYNEEGLVAVVAQDRLTGAVLMQAWADKDALKQSLTTSEMTYFSRTRNKSWTKGEESGHTQRLVSLKVDCDKDAVLALVEQTGPACHRDTGTCWSDSRAVPMAGFLGELDDLVAQRAKDKPEGSYTTRLLEDPSLAAGKVVEEAKEVATVLKGKPNPDTLQHEAADLLYHLLVACRGKGVGLREIVAELLARHGPKDGKDAKGKAG
jgi:phosphoribosyl-ATP pyrophosphohydrolase/phosphoribosyl-AMP cyclohydrolase